MDKLPTLKTFIADVKILGYLIVIWLVSYVFVRYFKIRLIGKIRETRGEHVFQLVDKLLTYSIYTVAIILSLNVLGVNIASLIAALGLFSVAVGFAAQTSISNLISGIFLLIDAPFQIGDAVDIGGTTGIVLSIDLLSTKLRTFDNIFVRIPNETVLKSNIKNFAKFDIRRIEAVVGISYDDDIEKAKSAIMEFIESSPLFLAEPEPMILTQELADSSVNLTVRVWTKRVDFLKAKDQLVQGIKETLDRKGITIPFPQIVVHQAK